MKISTLGFSQIFIFYSLFLLGCSDRITDETILDENDNVIYASVSSKSSLSRIDIDFDGGKGVCTWSVGDSFDAFDMKNNKTSYTIKPEDAGKAQAAFVNSGSPLQVTHAVFPSWLENSRHDTYITVKLPADYGVDSHSHNAPMLGLVKDKMVTFSHLVAMLRISLTNLPEGTNGLKIVADRPLAGTFIVNNIDADFSPLESYSSLDDKSNEVIIRHQNNKDPFYLPVPVGSYGNISVYTEGNNQKKIFELTNKKLECGKIYTVNKDYEKETDDFNIIKRGILNTNQLFPSISKVESVLNTMESNGSFTGINYNKQSKPTAWYASKHLDNLNVMISAYIDPKNTKYYGNDDLYSKIELALNFWVTKKPQHWNWWNHEVEEGKKLGIMLLKMDEGKKTLSAELDNKVVGLMKERCGDPYDKTGANRADIATHWVYRACHTRSVYDMNLATGSVFSTIEYTLNEGFQHDGSFHQHGAQLYIGGYGEEILKSVTLIATLVNGTSFSMPKDKVEIIRDFLLGTFYNTMRGRFMSFSVMGRSVSRPNTLDKSGSASFAEKMILIDPEAADKYQVIINRLRGSNPSMGVVSGHKHFYRSDYTMHVRPAYSFDVRMVSKKTCRVEYGNSENLRGYFMADGSTNILVDGNEYYNLMPVWRWSEIPGVTAPDYQNSQIPRNPAEWGTPGTSTFAGGVSDGMYGASAYDYYDSYKGISTGAKKSWFFFDDEVVCMGNVTSSAASPVTTINQCLQKGDVSVSDGSIQSGVEGMQNYSNLKWAYHNKVGYVFPQGGDVWLRNQIQQGTWKDINSGKSADRVAQRVFTIGFNHSGTTKKYAYIVVPGINSYAGLDAYLGEASPIRIVSNNAEVQSVYHTILQNWQTVFFRGGFTAEYNGMKIKPDKKCVVMLTKSGNQYKLHVADPSRSLSSTNVELTLPNGNVRNITVNFPTAVNKAGSTVEYLVYE